MIITIDGPAGAGKSTVARALARRLGCRFLDTGAMYRAVALAGVRRRVDWNRPEELARLATQIDIQVVGEKVSLDGEDVTETIRTSEITAVTRHAADNPQVRERLVALQRAIAGGECAGGTTGHGIVTEGRDQGTIVFPHADCKIFLTASAAERAKRRLRDLEAQGEAAPLADVQAAIERRDREDFSRAVGALRRAADAVEICTDGMTIDEAVDHLEAIARTKYPGKQKAEGSRQKAEDDSR